MPGPPDPSVWQTLADSRFVQTLVTALGMAIAFGAALIGFLKRQDPETRADRDLKRNLENGLPGHILKQVADELHGFREDIGDLRERVVRIETILKVMERDSGGR